MFPIEVSVLIFAYLSPEDFLRVRLVCKSWNIISVLCIKNWKSCCETAGLAVHNRSLVLSIGSGRSWKDIYLICKNEIKELNMYKEIQVTNARFDFADETREMKFIPPDILLSNHNNFIECWKITCFGPSFRFKADKIWSLRKEHLERLIDVNATYVYMLTLVKPNQITLRLVSTASGEIVSVHTGSLPTCYETEPLAFVSFRRSYCIRKCQNCDCFIMCSNYLDITSHSTFLYMAYLYDSKIYSVCHPLRIPDRSEQLKQLDSYLVDKVDLISCSNTRSRGLCEEHVLFVQSYYAIAKYVMKVDGPPELCGSCMFMPIVAEVILLEMELHGTTGTAFEGPIPGYCLSHCSRYWAVCNEMNNLFIYDLSTMSLKKIVHTGISKKFILHPIQFSMLYALMYCSCRSHPSHVSYILVYVGPGPSCGKVVRKVSLKTRGIIPLKATFVQLEMASFYQSPKEQTALTFYPNDFLVFHLPGWCM